MSGLLQKRISRNYDASPGDALTDYPTADDVDNEVVVSDDKPTLQTSSASTEDEQLHTQSPLLRPRSGKVDPASPRFDYSDDAGTTSDGAEAARTDRSEPPQQDPAPGVPYSQAKGVKNVTSGYSSNRLREMERFMRLMRSTIQGLDAAAVLNIYEKLERLRIPAGGVIFNDGDDSADGMYIIVKGEFAAYPSASMTSDLESYKSGTKTHHLAVFRQAQTIGENALIAGTVFSRLQSVALQPKASQWLHDHSGPSMYIDSTRPVACRALSDSVVLRLNRNLFHWFGESFPHALVNFILTTTTRQWRVAYFLLIDFLHLKDAWLTAMEPPGHAPPFKLIASSHKTHKSAPQAHTQHSKVPIFMATPSLGAFPSPIQHISPLQESESTSSASTNAEEKPTTPRSSSKHEDNGAIPRYPPPVPIDTTSIRSTCSAVLLKEPGDIVYTEGMEADSLFVVLSGHGLCYNADVPQLAGQLHYSCLGEDVVHVAYDGIPIDPAEFGRLFVPAGAVATRRLSPGCIGAGVSCFVGLPHRDTLVAVTHMEIAVFSRRLFTGLADSGPSAVPFARANVLLEIALAVGRSLVPLLRFSLALGLQRMWLRSGEVLFRDGDVSDGMYVVISGRLRAYTATGSNKVKRTIAERAGVSADGRLPSETGQTAAETVEEPSDYCASDSSYAEDDNDVPEATSPDISSARETPVVARHAAPSSAGGTRVVSAAKGYHAAAAARRRNMAQQSEPMSPTHQASSTLKVDIGRGETVGELSVLVRERRRAMSAVCIRDCEVVRISQASFELISQRYPYVMTHFTRVLAKRYDALTRRMGGYSQMGNHTQEFTMQRYLEHARAQPLPAVENLDDPAQLASFVHGVSTSAILPSPNASTFITIAVANAGGVPTSVSDFTQRLVSALERTGEGPVLHLTSTKLDMLLGQGTASKLDELFVRAKIGAWLSTQEEKHRFVVFEADASVAELASASNVVRSNSWRIPQSNTYLDVAKTVLKSVSGAGAAGVRHVGKRLDSAVKAGIGVSPSAFFTSKAAGAESTILRALNASRQQTPSKSSPWTKVCVLQADLCLLVGQAHTSPELSSIEKDCVYRVLEENNPDRDGAESVAGAEQSPSYTLQSRSFCSKELVLLHPDPSRRPAGTRNWLRLRRVSWHHHVRTWFDEDYDRIARHICGKARGVVLGGGGSRGLAHLGALQVFEERKIGIDVIGGTSQGAFMAACYALTLDTRACLPLVKRLADTIGNTWSLFSSLTLPIFSYFSGTAFNDALIDNFKDVQIEDLWINYFCVSTDVTNDRTLVHQTGPLWRYCRASMTVMGLLPPIWDRGRLLIDGGYTNNLPVEVLRQSAPQVNQIICVDVENKDNSGFEGIQNYGDTLSGWFIAWKWLLSLVRLSEPLRIPPMSELALKVSYISHNMTIRNFLKNADDSIIYIRPNVGTRFKLLDYHLMPTIVEEGIVATREVLDKWEMRQQRRLLHLLRKAAKDHMRAMKHAPTVAETYLNLAGMVGSRSTMFNNSMMSPLSSPSLRKPSRGNVFSAKARAAAGNGNNSLPAVEEEAEGNNHAALPTGTTTLSQAPRRAESSTFTIGGADNVEL